MLALFRVGAFRILRPRKSDAQSHDAGPGSQLSHGLLQHPVSTTTASRPSSADQRSARQWPNARTRGERH